MGLTVNELSMFDLNYLDCSKVQYVSYLKHKGFHVEALYYSCLDTSDEIYEQIINQKKSRWHFDELGFQQEDWPLIGVKKRNVHAESLDPLRYGISRLIEKGEVVFLSVEVFHVPHRHRSYQKERSPHSLMINGMAPDGDFNILDEAAPIFSHFKYPWSLVDQCFSEGTGFRNITFFEEIEKRSTKDIQKEAKHLFNQHLDTFEDSHRLHNHLFEFLVSKEEVDFIDTLQQLSAAYTLLSGSREMFSKFAKFIDMDKVIVETAVASSDASNQIRNTLNKAILRRRLKNEMLSEKVRELVQIEQHLVSLLKAGR
ncbi:hypothetical protein LCY76_23100 [Fictibacillus sp. KIGAM418]|uniref:Butirosin biosynthesis protein H N-terminal domain-containing protein n=1 Tax=Fictibacillus marinisediminis TaxID=2878389 RepID=A0A9X1XGW5_9BACL|nr:hypothetical protein [Fictibacillus marinisediminis]MCK6259463.1 hypothetical protein [Fictibacillus marinisediminis]